ICAHPLLGQGPMSFAANTLFPVAHPHNSLIQIAYEWGVPALLLVLVIVFICLKKSVSVFKGDEGKRNSKRAVVLSASLLVAAIHSLLSGIIVLPYPQLWLAIIVGLLWYELSSGAGSPLKHVHINWERSFFAGALALSCAGLAVLAITDFHGLQVIERRSVAGSDAPRFWFQGAITPEENPLVSGSPASR
ncbi:MAG: hypothetical protein R3292_07180, partial [Alcanivorax sp.]|nr:hypothetical protein [Alcanivorax sp.]